MMYDSNNGEHAAPAPTTSPSTSTAQQQGGVSRRWSSAETPPAPAAAATYRRSSHNVVPANHAAPAAAAGSSGAGAGGGGSSSLYISPYYAGGSAADPGAAATQQSPTNPNLVQRPSGGTAGSRSSPVHSPYKATAASWAPTGVVPSSLMSNANNMKEPPLHYYRHNKMTACFWIPGWAVVFLGPEQHPVPLQTFCILGLIAYGLDLANAREGVLYLIWLSLAVQSILAVWFGLWNAGDDGGGASALGSLLEASVRILFFVATSCWATLQCQWMIRQDFDDNTNETNNNNNNNNNNSNNRSSSTSSSSSSTARQLEAVLHGVLPVVFAALVTVFGTREYLTDKFGSDVACTAAPHVWCASLATAMVFCGSVESSFARSAAAGVSSSGIPGDSKVHHHNQAVYVIRKRVAWGHVGMLLLVPPLMHLAIFWRRIFSRLASTDDLGDFILAVTVPCVFLSVMHWLHESHTRYSPYAGVLEGIRALGDSQNLLRTAIPMATLLVTALALQLRYLIPICLKFAYRFMGVQPSPWLLTFYWTTATISLLAAGFLWNRVNSTGQPVFGEYHEDIVQLCLAICGLCLGKAFGMPWNMTPLPILGILGLTLWMYTRMMRYLAIFLFVVHATGVVVFTYRFVGIDQSLSLPLPGVSVSLTRFGMIVILASILIGVVTGLAVRSTGGYLAQLLKQMDAAGLTLVCYSIVLTILEIALIKRPVPNKELAGVQLEEEDEEEMLYDQGLVFLTSAILIGISTFMKNVRIIEGGSAAVIASLAIGKAISVFMDTAETESGGAVKTDPSGITVLVRALVAALLCAVMFAPRIFLEPVHVKSASSRQRRASGGGETAIPSNAMRTIFLYTFGFLPITLLAAIPYVLFPLINVLAGIYRNESYYSVTTPISELLGASICLWGLTCLSMLNYYLPDGGGAGLKKLSALAFLMGLGIIFTAPTMGSSVGKAAYSPYASMSSLGSQLITRSKSRTGGWGILSAALATLLAGLGPLELKERRTTSGRRDKYLMFRTMVFSLLFGGGVSWFITVQSMSEAHWLFLLLTLIASMALAFLGTVAAVLGHFVEPENFDEVEQVARTWFVALVAFLPIAGIPQLFRSGNMIHPFGNGGWLSTYLTVASLSALSFSLSLSFRHGKDQRTRGLGNIGCLVSWLCAIAVLYGRYGVAGLGTNFGVTSFVGIPATVIGTIMLGALLLAFEGEKSAQARGRRVSVTTGHKVHKSALRLNLPNLTRDNRWFPPFALTVLIFLLASVYTILLRGSGLFPFGGSIARSHEDVFTNVFGSAATASEGNQDLATLAQKTASHNLALSTSAKLAGSGFWTAKGFFGPILHLAGVIATLPSLFLLFNQHWLGLPVPSSQVTVCLPLHVIPVALCRGIVGLRAASLLIVVGAVAQLFARRQVEQTSKMRL